MINVSLKVTIFLRATSHSAFNQIFIEFTFTTNPYLILFSLSYFWIITIQLVRLSSIWRCFFIKPRYGPSRSVSRLPRIPLRLVYLGLRAEKTHIMKLVCLTGVAYLFSSKRFATSPNSPLLKLLASEILFIAYLMTYIRLD